MAPSAFKPRYCSCTFHSCQKIWTGNPLVENIIKRIPQKPENEFILLEEIIVPQVVLHCLKSRNWFLTVLIDAINVINQYYLLLLIRADTILFRLLK